MENLQYNEISALIYKIDSRLNSIEVKGDSVEHLLTSRIMLKTLSEEIQKLKPKQEEGNVI